MIFNVGNLYELTNIVHDKWFMVNEIKYDTYIHLLELPFYDNNPYKQKDSPRGILIFKGVRDVLLIDNEQIGSYDFNKVVYDPKKAMIRLKTNLPLTFDIIVNDSNFEIVLSRLV